MYSLIALYFISQTHLGVYIKLLKEKCEYIEEWPESSEAEEKEKEKRSACDINLFD